MATRRLQVVLDLDTSRWTGRLSSAGTQVRVFGGQVDGANRGVRRLGDGFNRMGSQMTTPMQKLREYVLLVGNLTLAYKGLQTVLMLGGGMLKQAGEVERLTVLMKGLSEASTEVGKNAEAQKNLRVLFDMARNSGYAMKELSDAFVKFKSGGVDPLNGSLQSLVNATAAFGGTSDTMHRASIAIQQMSGKGVVSMEELRQQLGEAVPTAMAAMARAAGKTMPEFAKMVSKGTVNAKPALKLMFDEFDRMYSGAGKKMAETLNGQINEFKTNVTLLSTSFAGMAAGTTTGLQAYLAEQQKLLDQGKISVEEFTNRTKDIGTGGLFAGSVSAMKEINEAMRSNDARLALADLGVTINNIMVTLMNVGRHIVKFRDEYGTALKGLAAAFIFVQGSKFFVWMTNGLIMAANAIRNFRLSSATAFGANQPALLAQSQALNKLASDYMRLEAIENARAARTMRNAGTAMQKVAAIKTEIASLRQLEVTYAQNITLLERQRIQQVAQLRTAQQLNAANIATGRSTTQSALNVKAAQDAVNASTRALINNRRLLTQTTGQLVAAERGLVVAETQATAASQAATVAAGGATRALQLKAMAARGAAMAVTFLGRAMSVALGPIGMIATALYFAASAAGVFENKANKATAAAARLMQGMADLDSFKAVSENRDRTRKDFTSVTDRINAGGSYQTVDDGMGRQTEVWVKDSAATRAKLMKERNGLIATFKRDGEALRRAQTAFTMEAISQDEQAIRARMDETSANMAAQHATKVRKLNRLLELGPGKGGIDKAEYDKQFLESAQNIDRVKANYISDTVLPSLQRQQAAVKEGSAEWNRLNLLIGRATEMAGEAKAQYGANDMEGLRGALVGTGKGADGAGKGLSGAAGKAASMAGRVAQLTDKLRGGNGELAKTNELIRRGAIKGTDAQLADIRASAASIDALSEAKRGLAENESFDDRIVAAKGRLAQMQAQLEDTRGELVKFDAQMAAGAFKGIDPSKIAEMRGTLMAIDQTDTDQKNKQIMDRLANEMAKVKTEADGLWSSWNAGTLEADERATRLRSRFEGMLDGIKDPKALEVARAKMEEIAQQLERVEAIRAMDDWKRNAEDIQLSLMNENEAREANFQRELQRQQILFDQIRNNAALSADEKIRAEARFQEWRRQAEMRMARESESGVFKMARDWAKLGQNIDGALTNALGAFVDGMFEADFSFGKFAGNIIKQLVKVIVQAMIAYAILSAIGMTNNAAGQKVSFGSYMKGQIGAGFGLDGGKANPATTIGFDKRGAGPLDMSRPDYSTPPIIPVTGNHTGGMIGSGKVWGNATASMFKDAQRFHTGGWMGGKPLRPGEVPIIGLEEELVLTKEQQRAIGRQGGGMGMPAVQVNVINNSGTEVDAEAGEPEFNGKEFVLNVVLEATNKQGPFRDALAGLGGNR